MIHFTRRYHFGWLLSSRSHRTEAKTSTSCEDVQDQNRNDQSDGQEEAIKRLEIKPRKKRKPADYFGVSDYYFENGLRKVYPYYFTFECYAKKRWINQTLTTVFQEFQQDPKGKGIYRSLPEILATGDVAINGETIWTDRILKNKDYLTHRVHRHETPVIGAPVELVAEDEHVVVVNKPSTIPVHPCGRYCFNTVPFILRKEHGYQHLQVIHRLDRMTSGVQILAKSLAKAREMQVDVLHKRVEKEYIARVIGAFPDGMVKCDQPLGIISRRYGLYGVIPNGKPSKTVFERLSYNGTTSVVRCQPQTGRTHQIRLHLQYLGYPVLNDPLYSKHFGPNKGKGAVFEKSLSEIEQCIVQSYNVGTWVTGDNPDFLTRMEEVKSKTKQEHYPNTKQSNDHMFFHSHDEACLSNSQEGGHLLNRTPTDLILQSHQFHKEALHSHEHHVEALQSHHCHKESSKCHQYQTSFPLGEELQIKTHRLHNSNLPVDMATATTVTSEQLFASPHELKYPAFVREKWIPDENCPECRKTFLDPSPSDLIMYLHALKYQGPGWEYQTPLPDWAHEDWTETS